MPEQVRPPMIPAKLPRPKGLTTFDTLALGMPHFHFCIYGETSMRKTTKLGEFCDPKKTLYILTRQREQLIPVRSQGFKVAHVEDAAAFRFAMLYGEQLWAEFKAQDPSLGELEYIGLDDATEAINLLVDDVDARDNRRSYLEAGKELREILKAVRRKKCHLGVVALARVRENPITGEENVGPDLPPSMLNFLMTELEFTFYVKPDTYQLLTERDFFSVKDTDPNTGKEKTFRRVVFAKSKVPREVKNPLLKYEAGTLRDIWNKILAVMEQKSNVPTQTKS